MPTNVKLGSLIEKLQTFPNKHADVYVYDVDTDDYISLRDVDSFEDEDGTITINIHTREDSQKDQFWGCELETVEKVFSIIKQRIATGKYCSDNQLSQVIEDVLFDMDEEVG